MAKMTAYQWLTSDDPAAVAWRKQATMPAWNKVYERAEGEKSGQYITLPANPMERPPTGRETTGGRFFNVPVAHPNAQAGKFFTIPTDDGDK